MLPGKRNMFEIQQAKPDVLPSRRHVKEFVESYYAVKATKVYGGPALGEVLGEVLLELRPKAFKAKKEVPKIQEAVSLRLPLGCLLEVRVIPWRRYFMLKIKGRF